jgi:hypothetical protein
MGQLEHLDEALLLVHLGEDVVKEKADHPHCDELEAS